MSNTIDFSKIIENTKYITIEYKNTQIKIPLIINMSSMIAYEEQYKESQNVRKAFCNLLYKLTEYYKEQNIEVNFEELEDDELLEIMKKLLDEDDYVGKYFRENHYEYTFENFYNSYEYQRREMAEQFKKIFKPINDSFKIMGTQLSDTFKNAFRPMENIKLPDFSFANTTNAYKSLRTFNHTNLYDSKNLLDSVADFDENIELFSPTVLTNKLLTENNEFHKHQMEIMLENQQAQQQMEKEGKRKDVINLWMSIISLLIAIAALIVSILSMK